jgi:dynein heavy chain 2
LAKIDEKVAGLKVTFGKKTAEGEMLKLDLQKAEDKIKKASNLLEKLSGESGRWQTSLDDIKVGLNDVPYHSLMASSFVNYLANKDEGERMAKLSHWQNLVKISGFSLVEFMSDESEILEFVSQGLPSDQLSVENALISLNTYKSPLIIDPNYALSQWLVGKLKADTQLEVVSSQEKKIVSILEICIRFGKTLIVNEVDEVESLYFNILRKDLKKQGPRLMVSIGDKTVDWSDNFQLIFMSRNHSIKLEPNAAALVNVVNNLVTTKGLEDKLLSLIINDQKPGLEQKKKECLEQERYLKIEISKLEKKLLEELAETTGNILENVTLFNSLEETKTKSIEISSSLQQSSKLKENLEKERNVYHPLAAIGTKVFLQLQNMKNLNNMYCFSLKEFTKVFKTNLKVGKDLSDTKQFISEVGKSLFKCTFTRFSYAMQKKDKLAFALYLTTCIPGVYQENEYDFILDRIEVNETKISLPSWANESSLSQLCKFNTIFPSVVKNLKFEKDEWRQWYSATECERSFPTTIMLRPVQRLMMIKIFREDRLLNALEEFACQSLGMNNINEIASSIPAIYALEQSSETPLLFITSIGSDPSKEIEEFANVTVGKEKFYQISMGGGQNEIALKTLQECAEKGEWVCLKNLHLVPNFLTQLEKTLNNTTLSEGFKLFLTTEEHPKFPVVLLETCFKLSYESPPGLRMNVERVYSAITPSQMKQMSPEESRLTFLLAYFHALLQERRDYIPQGWSKFYEFSLSDFKSGNLIMETIMTEHKNVDWGWPLWTI